MFGFTKWASGAVVLVAAAGVQAAVHEPIDVELSAPTPVVKGDADVTVTVTLTNRAHHPITLLKSQLPTDSADGPLFKITHNNERIRYQGRIIKRAAPQAADFVRLEPGASLRYDVELTTNYDFNQNGHYTIEYVSRGRHGDAATLNSEPLNLWLEGRSERATDSAQQFEATAAASLSFTSCSSSQQSSIRSAVTAATNYATSATSYLSGGTPSVATQRFKKWFGTPVSGWNTAYQHYSAVQNAFTTKAITVDCSCTDRGTYAYVYPTRPYKIYVCGAFWSAPNTGTDSRGGTLVHEMTHFNVVAGTDDWAYGQSAAASLASSNPTRALDNADNHEYFAENTPSLP